MEKNISPVHFDGIMFQSEYVIGEDDDFVVALLVVPDQELTSSKLVWIHHID